MTGHRKAPEPETEGYYNLGNWNCKVGRNKEAVAKFIERLLRENDLDVLALQEAAGYRKQIKSIASRYGYTVYQPTGVADAANNALLFRRNMEARNPFLRVMKRRWWGAANGTWRAPRSFITVRAGKIRWYGVHRVAYQFDAHNRAANVEYDAALVRQIKARPNLRHVAVGDWNDGQQDATIRKVKESVSGRTVGKGIEYGLSVGECELSKHRELEKGGSDHHARKFVVRWWE